MRRYSIRKLYEESGEGGLEAVNTLYKKLTQRLMFNLHEIDDDYDVFVAFETMNNRGKKLTNLELLKNRLIYLTTLYDDEVFDEKDKSALRKKINDTWKEVYYQLGRNKSVPLSDDDFLRAHWIIYFRYSRKRGDDYIKFLLSKFSSKGIFEKAPVLVETEAESVISDDVTDADDTEVTETEEQEIIEVSKLQPKEIEDYVNSLKDMAKYWYGTYFPFESANLTPEEQKRVDRLNRIGIGHFRPLVTAVISRRDISANSRVKIFEAVERFIFVAFRLGNFNASYGAMIGVGTYYAKYVLADENMFGTFAWFINIPLIIALIFTPTIVQKWNGMYKLNKYSYMVATVGRLLVAVAGYMGNIPLMLAFTALAALGQGPWQGDMNAVIASCSEYSWLTKHKHVDGIMYSCTSLGVKIGGGLGTAIVGLLLDFSGFKGTLTVQPDSAINMLHIMYLIVPFALDLIITFILSKMNVEKANAEIKEKLGISENEVVMESQN